MVTTTMMVMISCGLGPDSHQARLEGRKRLAEAIALNSSIHLSNGDVKRIERVLTSMVDRDPDLLSGAIHQASGNRDIEIGDHQAHWTNDTDFSTDSQIKIPLMTGDGVWGTVELRFTPIRSSGWKAMVDNPWTRFVFGTGAISFLLFCVYLKFTLKQLDPQKAIPKRVQFALDNITEGLLVTDRRGRVLLANEAFSTWMGIGPEECDRDRRSPISLEVPWGPTVELPVAHRASERDDTVERDARTDGCRWKRTDLDRQCVAAVGERWKVSWSHDVVRRYHDARGPQN